MPLNVRLLVATEAEMTENLLKTFKENNFSLCPHSKYNKYHVHSFHLNHLKPSLIMCLKSYHKKLIQRVCVFYMVSEYSLYFPIQY
jgi:hypothetical protein